MIKHRRRSHGSKAQGNTGGNNPGNTNNGNGNGNGLPQQDIDYIEQPVAAAGADDGIAETGGVPTAPAQELVINTKPAAAGDEGADDDEAAAAAPAAAPAAEPRPYEPPKVININELKRKSAAELLETAESLGLDNIARARKPDLVFSLLKAAARRGEHIYGEGVLEIMPDGYGFLRGPDSSYLAGPDDVYISPSQIRRFALRTGDTIAGRVRPPKDNERYFALLKVDTINFEPPEVS